MLVLNFTGATISMLIILSSFMVMVKIFTLAIGGVMPVTSWWVVALSLPIGVLWSLFKTADEYEEYNKDKVEK